MYKDVGIELLLICGCLNAIAEKDRNIQSTPKQITEIENRLIVLLNKYFPESLRS